MTAFIIVWSTIILVGVLVIMSGYSKASEEEKEKKKKNAKTFVIVIAILLILGSLGVFRGCDDESYDDDPSEWARHT